MRELVNSDESRRFIRPNLLTTVSALALSAYTGSMQLACAENANQPTVWVELGGQMEQLEGTDTPFTAPFMFVSPTPKLYQEVPLVGNQAPPRFAFGLEGKLDFRPVDTDWVFSASIRYSRSHLKRFAHVQGVAPTVPPGQFPMYTAPFAEIGTQHSESHAIVDFSAGRDAGIGMFGRDSRSTINAGIRFAQFSTRGTIDISARPEVEVGYFPYYGRLRAAPVFNQYDLAAHASRSFHGVGPSLSWDASANLLGGTDGAALRADWGINAAVLFGRQKAATQHNTQVHHLSARLYASRYYNLLYPSRDTTDARSRSVVVPNLGGFAGLSVKYPNAKISLGYRADFFFGAVDAGTDTRNTKNLGFHGPFATISIGLGG